MNCKYKENQPEEEIENSRNIKSILKKWKFPANIIEKYCALGIKEVFEWQADCLNNTLISGIIFSLKKLK